MDRVMDACKYENDVCEDAENPFNKDCELSNSVINCSGDRCMFKELWAAKVAIILMIIMAVVNFSKYKYVIIVAGIFVLINFVFVSGANITNPTNVTNMSNTLTEVPKDVVYLNNNTLEYAPAIYYGSKIMPSYPLAGFFIGIGLIGFLIYLFLKADSHIISSSFRRRG
jgi:hypothetical protein